MNRILTIIFLTAVSLGLTAQVEETSYNLRLGKQNAFTMDHEGADQKMASKILENAFKKYGKVKKNRKASEWICSECQIGIISSSPVSVYFKVESGKNQSTSYVFFDDGEKFISEENDKTKSQSIKDLLMEIDYDVERAVIKKDLEQEEKDLKGFEKDLVKLEKKNGDYHKDIENYKKKIIEAEENIEKNLQSQEDKTMEIIKQRRKVESTTSKLNHVGRG